jgi:putative addiction module component (TIGR02574 family)
VSNQARQVLEDALRLSIDERADLAAQLLRSLDQTETGLSQDEVDQRWAAELTRRAERALSGDSVGQDGESVLAAIESKLRSR